MTKPTPAGMLKHTNRELDALVAEKVMGLTKEDLDRWDDNRGNNQPKHYSTDIAAAWEVVEKMIEKGTRLDVNLSGVPNQQWGCYLMDLEWLTYEIDVRADTAPKAICLAALKAVGVEIDDFSK